MSRLQNLYVEEQIDFAQDIISSYIQASLIIVNSRNDIGNRLALSKWSESNSHILIPRSISTNEQLSAILQVITTGKTNCIPKLSELGQKLLGSDSRKFLAYLILHEIAHIKNNWRQNKEIECNLWASEQIDIV